MRNMDKFRREFRQFYDNTRVQVLVLFGAWVILHVEPKYTNMFYFFTPDQVAEADIAVFKILNYVKAALLLLVWLATASCQRSALSTMDVDADDMESTPAQ